MRILVVDDDDITCQMLKHALEQFGYEVELAENGKEALELVKKGDYRLVISDWDMPVMNGLELCQAIRHGDFPSYIYFILLTAHRDQKYLIEGLSSGADDFLFKPFDLIELKARICVGERILGLETREVAIFALARLTESRDPETGAHLERVQNYCRILARNLYKRGEFSDELDNEFIRLIYITSPLHDIGKVGIPDSVLLKPGRFTEEEFEVMKRHTLIGADTLDAALERFPNARFLQMARDIALSHHERFDGTGYPHQKSGDDIPLSGRIVSLADVYDALTSKRVYKKDFSHDVSESIILEGDGTQFDPRIIEAFKQTIDRFKSVSEEFREEVLVEV